jgi:hypothetical protein
MGQKVEVTGPSDQHVSGMAAACWAPELRRKCADEVARFIVALEGEPKKRAITQEWRRST